MPARVIDPEAAAAYDAREAALQRFAVYVECDPEHAAFVRRCLEAMVYGLKNTGHLYSEIGPVLLDEVGARVTSAVMDVAAGNCDLPDEPWHIQARAIAAAARVMAQEVGPR